MVTESGAFLSPLSLFKTFTIHDVHGVTIHLCPISHLPRQEKRLISLLLLASYFKSECKNIYIALGDVTRGADGSLLYSPWFRTAGCCLCGCALCCRYYFTLSLLPDMWRIRAAITYSIVMILAGGRKEKAKHAASVTL